MLGQGLKTMQYGFKVVPVNGDAYGFNWQGVIIQVDGTATNFTCKHANPYDAALQCIELVTKLNAPL